MSRLSSAITVLTAGIAICATATFNQPSQAQSSGFVCTVDKNNVPTTYANTPNGPVPVFKWTEQFRPPYTPMRRCQEVTSRMNNFKARGSLDYLTSGKVNGYEVICAGTSCNRNNVLFTLLPGRNGGGVLQQLEANRAGASGPVNAFVGGNNNSGSGSVTINLNNYINRTRPENPRGSRAIILPLPNQPLQDHLTVDFGSC